MNDSLADAQALYKLINIIPHSLQIVPYNSLDAKDLRRPDQNTIEQFQNYLAGFGLNVKTYSSFGSDIAAGCGQLIADSCPE